LGTSWGTLANQNPADGGSSQTWTLISAGSGLYKIQSQSSGLYLGITDMSTSDGANALLWGDTGTADHLWSVVHQQRRPGPPVGRQRHRRPPLETHPPLTCE
jgi:hypothetical protein